jgi:hypothetical protein
LRAILAGLLLCALHTRAEEILPPFWMNNLLYTNVAVIQETPVEVLLRLDRLGFKRIKLQDLPTDLRDRFPYDPIKAAEFEKENAIKTKLLREQQRREAYETLLRQEREIERQIETKNEDMVELQRTINVWRAKPPGHGKAAALHQLLDQKLLLMRQIDDLRKQLRSNHAMQAQYR